jgi:hypothetical protein
VPDISDVFLKSGFETPTCLAYINLIVSYASQFIDASIIFIILCASFAMVFDSIIFAKCHLCLGILKIFF